MRAVSELRALAVRIAKSDDVHIKIDENQYGWHVIVYAGQPVDCIPSDHSSYESMPAFSTIDAPIMVAVTATTLNAAVQQAYDELKFEEQA